MHHAIGDMLTYSESRAWLITCVSGLLTGVILGAETSVSVEAFLSVTLVIALAIVVCARLLRAPMRDLDLDAPRISSDTPQG